jgi:hypothetical protein
VELLGEVEELDVVLEIDGLVSDGLVIEVSVELVVGLLALVVSANPAGDVVVSVEVELVDEELGVEDGVLLALGADEP